MGHDRTRWCWAAIVLALVLLSGCATTSNSPYATPSDGSRDSLRAQKFTAEAVELMQSDPDKAQKLLQEALTADVFHGPAHNNLGVVHLKAGRCYEAANEFEWARKLMPGNPDPRMNLALTLERAGRIDEAIATYNSALEVYPGHIPTMQALTRLQVKHKRTDEKTTEMLKEIALSGETAQWREWAQHQVVRMVGE
jgi:predicted Zn-dependent protease